MRRLHTIWGAVIFLAVFAAAFPFFMFLLLKRKWKKYSYLLNNVWAFLFFNLSFIPYKRTFYFKPDQKKQYIFCANHFSVLDIPTMGLVVNQPFSFVGKSSIAKKPFFGFMYEKFHITVDRRSLKDKYNSLVKSLKAIDEGYSLIIFPEGGIISKNPPALSSFKDGAFRVAIERSIPIVPITLADNWEVLRDDGKVLLKRKTSRIVVHPPVDSSSYTINQLDALKEKTYSIINDELKRLNSSEKEVVISARKFGYIFRKKLKNKIINY